MWLALCVHAYMYYVQVQVVDCLLQKDYTLWYLKLF